MEESETNKITREVNPKDKANFLSHFLFCWQLPIFVKNRSKEFTEDDIYKTAKEHEAKDLGDKLETKWQEEEHFRKIPSLKRALFHIFGPEYIIWGMVSLPVDLSIILLQPLCLQRLLHYFSSKERDAYIFASAMALLFFLRSFIIHWFNLKFVSLGMKIRIACCSLIYRKCLKMKNVTVGQAVNLVTNDTSRFDDAFMQLYYGWNGLVKLLIGTIYIDVTFGHAAVTGMGILILGFFIQMYTSKQMAISRMRIASKTDERIRIMSDVTCGIQIIKMYTWEKPFTELITNVRKSELREIVKSNLFRLTNHIFRVYLIEIAIFVCILVIILIDLPLTAEYLFALVNIYNNLAVSVLMRVPLAAMYYSDVKTSVERIEKFLLSGHQKKGAICKYQSYVEKRKGVHLNTVSVKLGDSQILENVTFRANPGELVGVVGHAGCGKSTLLQVILGEVATSRGSVEVGGSLSYACQEAWIFPASVRQNILFGEEMKEEKYRKVLQVCALERDLTLFPKGDLSLVGERGVMLSGGQKSRINLARAIYKDADIYLLDDPLSAVDAHVAQHIYHQCISKYLKEKCVILVTHRISFLSNASKVYCFEKGKIVDVDIKEYCNFTDRKIDDTEATCSLSSDQAFKVKEHRSSGFSNKAIFLKYFFSGRHWSIVVLIVLNFLIIQVFRSSINCYFTFWINSPQVLTPKHFLYIYATNIAALVVLTHAKSFIFAKYCASVSKNLHHNLFRSVVGTTMKFFNDHSSGRVLNRFSSDMGNIDEKIPVLSEQVFTEFLTVLSAVIIISAINYWLVIPTVLVFALFYIYVRISEPININLRRTKGITQSPILTYLVATVQGLPTVRASQRSTNLAEEFDDKLDVQSSVSYLHKATYYTFCVWVDLTCSLYVAVVIFSFLVFKSEALVGDVGLAITQASFLVGMVQYGMKMWSEFDAQMTSVERVLEYSHLEPETDDGKVVPDCWPQFGNIKYEAVSLRYSPEKPLILKNINFVLKPGEKVGVVGRTGAGKTSLINALFRLFDYEGTISVDGVDTKTIPLSLLRSNISIIPQDPVFFSENLRKNLDPFDVFSDYEIWAVLEALQLKKFVKGLPSGLDSAVAERGSNFSVGEKQLLCLVRAMLRRCKIVVFDEATASIDLETDALIQSVIRKQFKTCTVLTIAHRLNTVVDSDKIVVMDSGEIVEIGKPEELLGNVDGYFSRLAKQS